MLNLLIAHVSQSPKMARAALLRELILLCTTWLKENMFKES